LNTKTRSFHLQYESIATDSIYHSHGSVTATLFSCASPSAGVPPGLPSPSAMHLALPPRKSSHPQLYTPRSSRLLSLRRSRLKYVILCILIGAIIFLFSGLVISPDLGRIAVGAAPVVIVTVLDSETFSKPYIENIKENRNEYAKRHGEIASEL
jgi:hypothetical protein